VQKLADRYTYLGLVAGSLHGVVVEDALADTATVFDDEVDDDSGALVADGDAGVCLVATLLDGAFAELTDGVLGEGDVDDAAGGGRVGARQGVLADDDRAAGRQRSDGEDADSADDAAHRAVSPRLLRRRLRPEFAE